MTDQFASIFGEEATPEPGDADNQFAAIMPRAVAPPTSATGAFVRGGVRGVLPAIGGIIGGQVGGEAGAFVGAAGGPVTAFGGAVAGGLTGAYLGSTAVGYAQNWALSKLPDTWREAIGMDDRQQRLDEGQHPIASFLGGIAPYAVTMNPTNAARTALPANATAIQRVMANPKTARVFGGAAMGGFELGQEAVGPDPIDWRKVAISTGMGVVFNRPNVIGQRIGEFGAAPARRAFGLPSPAHAAPEAAQPAAVAPATEAPVEAPPARVDRGIAPSLFHATIAQAGDAKVMGPGVTEEVFHGTHEMNDAARLSTQEDARVEASVIGPPPAPDLHSIARRSTPDLFAHYDALRGQENDFQAWLARDPADTTAQSHLAAVQSELAAVEPQVAAAYRRAAEATGQPPVEAPAAETAPATPERPIDVQKKFIAEDVAAQLEKAGRPHDEAVAAGQLIAARYEARAAMFKGALGSAEDLYNREGAEILRPGEKSTQYVIRAPRKVNVQALSLFQFLAHRGGLAPHPDVQHILGENPFVPGFGRLVRKGGMSLDRAREAAVEAGYLHDQGAIEGTVTESTINQLLDAVGEEARGNKLYRAGHAPNSSDVVFDRMAPEEEAAYERGEHVPEARSPLMTDEDERETEMFQRKQRGEEPNLFAEREAEGQMGLPGTERITQGELAQRAADAALKPKVAQKPMDVGLFGDDAAQKELFQQELPDRAKSLFGVTSNPKEVGFVLPDGAMLDLSGRHQDAFTYERRGIRNVPRAGQRDYMRDQRNVDHRELTELYPDDIGSISGGELMLRFMNDAHAIRNFPGNGFAVTFMPTDQQILQLVRGHNQAFRGESLRVDIEAPKDGENIVSRTFEKPTVEAVTKWMREETAKAGLPQAQAAPRELFQHDPNAPVFYSAVSRAIDNARTERASPEQWLATIKNTSGVKAEEMEWLGLADWLKEQKGPVTRAQIADYVRANSIEVREVRRGGDAEATLDAMEEVQNRLMEAYEALPEQILRGHPVSAHGMVHGIGTGYFKPEELPPGVRDLAIEYKAARERYDKDWEGLAGEPRHASYQLPGGENYRELLLTLPRAEGGAQRAAGARAAVMARQLREKYGENYLYGGKASAEELSAYERVYQEAAKEVTPFYVRSHWEEPNVLAHVRFNDRVIDGKRTLFLEEVQSDWHQQGRRKGYAGENDEAVKRPLTADEARRVGLDAGDERYVVERNGQMIGVGDTAAEAREYAATATNPVPDAPFKTSWSELSLKRMIRYAAEHGYEQVAWTPGKVQAERYDLSKQVGRVRYVADVLDAWDPSGKKAFSKVGVKPEELPDYIGKEAAEKLLAQEPKNVERLSHVNREDLKVEQTEHQYVVRNKDGREVKIGKGTVASEPEALEYAERYLNGRADEINRNRELEGQRIGPTRELSGLDLKVGGEGMSAFYDKMLPAAANKLVKKFGAKVGTAEMATGDVSNFDITHTGSGWRVVDLTQNQGQGTFIGPMFRSGAEAETWLKDQGHTNASAHTLPITDTLREAAVGEGFPLFQAARGSFRAAEGLTLMSRGAGATRPIIRMMADANASTFIHETGHEWLEQLMRDAAHDQAPDQIKADAAATLQWLGVDKPGAIGRRQHERFARGFEQYMREGIAPSAGLANVFARFKSWLTQIYQTIKGLGAPISDDIRRVFDRMIAAEDHGAVIAPERGITGSMADEHELDAQTSRPEEADPWADRIAAERNRGYDADPESTHDYEAWLAAKAEHEATGPEPGEHPDEPPPGQAGPGGAGPGELHGVRQGPGDVAEGGRVGDADGAQRAGGTYPAGEGAGLPSGGAEPRSGELGAVPLAPTPAARFEPVSERVVDLAGNIRVDNLTSVADIAQAIHDSAERNADFVNVRGSMTKGQMMDLADAMGLDPEKINEANLASLLGGTANLAPRILAARKLVVQSAGLVADAMKAAASGTDEDVARLAMVIARHDMIQGVLAGATAEWGRAGSAFHSLMEGWGKAQAVDDFLKQNTGRTLFQLKQIAKLGTQLDTPGKVSKYLRDAQNRSFGGMILEYWINGLISGPATHTTYMIGNAILAAEKAGPETAAAALIGSLRKAMGREGETVRLGEVGAQFRAAVRNLPGAIEAGLEGLRSGMTTLLPGEEARPLIPFSGDTSLVTARGATNAPVSWADVGSQMFSSLRSVRDGLMSGAALIAAGGEAGAPLMGWHWSPLGQIPDIAIRGVPAIPLGTAFRAPGRFIAAIHSFFRMTNYSMEKARLAYRTAANEGLTGTAFDARVADVWQNPSEAVMEQARKEATNLTLMGQGGAFVKALSQLTNAKVTLPVLGEFAPLKFIDPFVHIGANVINQSIVQRTPVGILSKEIRADLLGQNGNVAQDTAMARMLVGTALSVAFGGLAAQGLASGSGPKDPKESAMWRLAGNQPHSVRIGDMWIDVHRLGPMGMLMGVAADMYDVAHQVGEEEYLEAASHLHHAIVQNVLDESFMRGPAELIRAVEDPGRYGDAYIRNMLASFVPFSVGMAQVARASDPYSRQARSVTDAMMAKVPGMSESLLPRRDIWGEPMANLRTLGPQGLLAVWVKQVSTDPVNTALYDLGIFPGQVPRKIRNVDLTDQEYDDFSRYAGRMAKMRLDTIVKSPDWRTWPNHAKASVVQEIIRQSRETARGIIMARYPHIPRDATAAKLEALSD